MKEKKPGRGGCILRLLLLAALIAAAAAGYFIWRKNLAAESFAPVKEGFAQVHFIDVGQGDCELIIAENGETVLIDCGEEEYSPAVRSRLGSLGITRLDYIIVTHPHSDHVGGMADIIKNIGEVGTVIMPKIPEEYIPTTLAYESLIDAAAEKGCEVIYTKTETLSLGEGSLKIIKPDYSGENLNNYSAVVKYTLGSRSFLFSGDLEADMEQQIIDSGADISADVFKLAHHGSSTSNSLLWLAKASPKYYVCECGAGNSYGHPHGEVVRRIKEIGGTLLRTDTDGGVIFETDGKVLEYQTEKQPYWR